MTPCPVCQASDAVTLFTDRNRRGDYDASFTASYVQCRRCRHIHLDPVPDARELRSLYSDSVATAPDGRWARLAARVDTITSRFTDGRRYRHSLPRGSGASRKLLDVGCNDGEKLLGFHERGWEISGVDVSGPAIEAARARLPGGTFYRGTLAEAGFAAGSFDCVRIDNVLEHVARPIELLAEIHRVLAPGGQLFVYVPNGESFTLTCLKRYSINSWIPYHVSLFTRASLALALGKAGFGAGDVTWYPCTPLPWLYLSFKQLLLGKSTEAMSVLEKCGACLLTPLALGLNLTPLAEELVARAVKSRRG